MTVFRFTLPLPLLFLFLIGTPMAGTVSSVKGKKKKKCLFSRLLLVLFSVTSQFNPVYLAGHLGKKAILLLLKFISQIV